MKDFDDLKLLFLFQKCISMLSSSINTKKTDTWSD